MIAFGGCAAACVVMAVAAPIVFGVKSLGISLKLVLLCAVFVSLAYAVSYMVRADSEAADEIAYGLEQPDWNVPEDYSEETNNARERVCRTLNSIHGLIISYGIIAIMLWAVTVLLAWLGGIDKADYNTMLLLVSFITLAMALGLSILTIAYIRDLPAARKYRQLILEEGQDY
jgi:hypothetical protein